MELTRFYLELQKDPHGPEVGMFIGNLPANLSQRQYETLLLDLLDEGCKFSSIGPIYYEYGSMVITFDNSRASVQAYELLKSSYHEEKKLLGDFLKVILKCNFQSSFQPLSFVISDAVTNRETVHAPSHGMSSPSLRQWQKRWRTRVAANFQLQKTPESSPSL